MPDAVPATVIPRPAATVLLIRDDPFEVLMIRRREGGSFGSAIVFPGGVVDPEDRDAAWIDRLASGQDLTHEERALRIAGVREVFEEAGLIAATVGAPIACDAGTAFDTALGDARLDLEALVKFGHWITPEGAPRRFDTHFYLCPAPRDGEAVCDGAEAVALEWASPQDLLARAEAGERSLLFPTRMNLARLAESASVADALAAAMAREVITVLVQIERRPDGVLTRLPPGAGYPVDEVFTPSTAKG